MKLSKTQQAVLDEAKRDIDTARAHDTYEAYCEAKGEHCWESYRKYWLQAREGIALVECNSRTLKALEAAGLIEIINDGGSYVDTIRVLNY